MSSTLFYLILEHIIINVLKVFGWEELNSIHKIIWYADDLVLSEQHEGEVTIIAEMLVVEAKKIGLRISRVKTTYFHKRLYRNTRDKRKTLRSSSWGWFLSPEWKKPFKKVFGNFNNWDVLRHIYFYLHDDINIRILNALICTAALLRVLVSKLIYAE